MKKIIYLMLFSLVITTGQVAFAETKHILGDTLLDVAMKHYEKGQYEVAERAFGRVLKVNPTNQVALDYLNKLGVPQGLYQNHQSSSAMIHSMGQEIEDYQWHMTELLRERNHLNRTLRQLYFENEQLKDDFATRDLNMYRLEKKVAQMEDQLPMTNKVSSNSKVEQIIPFEAHVPEIGMFIEDENEDMFSESFEDEEMVAMKEYLEFYTEHDAMVGHESDLLAQQDKLIHVLEEYLGLREEALNKNDNAVIIKEMDLILTEKELMHNILKLQAFEEHYLGLVQRIDLEDGKEYDLVNFLEKQYHQVQVLTEDQDQLIEEQQTNLASLEKDLEEAQFQIRQLLEAKESLLRGAVQDLKSIKDKKE